MQCTNCPLNTCTSDLGLNHNPPNLTWLQLLDAELVKGSMSIVDGLVVADEEPAKAADEEKAAPREGMGANDKGIGAANLKFPATKEVQQEDVIVQSEFWRSQNVVGGGGFSDSSAADESIGGRDTNGEGRLRERSVGTHANFDLRFRDGAAADEGFRATGGVQDTTCSYEVDREEDPSSATDKGFGIAG